MRTQALPTVRGAPGNLRPRRPTGTGARVARGRGPGGARRFGHVADRAMVRPALVGAVAGEAGHRGRRAGHGARPCGRTARVLGAPTDRAVDVGRHRPGRGAQPGVERSVVVAYRGSSPSCWSTACCCSLSPASPRCSCHPCMPRPETSWNTSSGKQTRTDSLMAAEDLASRARFRPRRRRAAHPGPRPGEPAQRRGRAAPRLHPGDRQRGDRPGRHPGPVLFPAPRRQRLVAVGLGLFARRPRLLRLLYRSADAVHGYVVGNLAISLMAGGAASSR